MEALNIFVKSIFVDNMIFAYFLGMCSFLAVSKNVKTAIGLGVAVIFAPLASATAGMLVAAIALLIDGITEIIFGLGM